MQQSIGVVLLAGLIGCAACAPAESARTPPANFLVVAGDSTFWVTADTSPPAVRRSSILLARFDGRFHELYLTDDDRSYFDAVIVGHRVYRRDIVRGDSSVLFEDSTIATIADAYASAHPGERPLQPGEDEADDPGMVSTSETEIIDVLGPFVTLERHIDLDQPAGAEKHETRRSVVDMRSGRTVVLADLMPDTAVGRVLQAGRRAMSAAFDSIRRSSDSRAHAATAMLRDFVFDSTSFSLTADARGPAIAFFLPGRGLRAGGYALPLPPVGIPTGPWWAEVRAALPDESTSREDVWRGGTYAVVARYDSASPEALLAIRTSSGREVRVTNVPTPVHRVLRLDEPAAGDEVLRSMARAFDEAAHYAKPLRTTSGPPGPMGSDPMDGGAGRPVSRRAGGRRP
jgi:hypothetical protein